MIQRTQMDSWKKLEKQALERPRCQMLSTLPSILSHHITLDLSAYSIDKKTQDMLLGLGHECQLEERIQDLFSGHHVNVTEDKPALHTALRVFNQHELWVNGCNIISGVQSTQNKMRLISSQLREGTWLGYSKKVITDIVNIGIGGSHLGPAFCLHALKDFATNAFQYHFISDMDASAFAQVTSRLNPETTLFIVSSKSFTTVETINNAKKALAWINKPDAINQHVIAVTACPEKARLLGIDVVLPIWDWVGGRYSVCSAINLIACIAIGFELFTDFLQGAYDMDQHFRDTPFELNLPVNLALLGIWTNNFLKIHHLLLLTYAYSLEHFAPYIQQLDMESNGKSIDKQGRAVNYATGPLVWGGSGSHAQHSYFQLLCQGTHQIAAEFISIDTHEQSLSNQLCLAQKDVLYHGVFDENNDNAFVRGNAYISHIRLNDASPKTIGSLIALYEHKIYVQSVIWQTNAFDQPGVEHSKRLAKKGLSYA